MISPPFNWGWRKRGKEEERMWREANDLTKVGEEGGLYFDWLGQSLLLQQLIEHGKMTITSVFFVFSTSTWSNADDERGQLLLFRLCCSFWPYTHLQAILAFVWECWEHGHTVSASVHFHFQLLMCCFTKSWLIDWLAARLKCMDRKMH